MIKKTEPKPKTVLDDIDNEFIYDKPESKSNKPKIKQIEILPEAKVADKIPEKTQDIEKHDFETENFDFNDDFGTDSFSEVQQIPAKEIPAVNKISTHQSTSKSTNGEDLNQYIGDVSFIQNIIYQLFNVVLSKIY